VTVTAAPVWPPPIGTALRFEAECDHGTWDLGRLIWDGRPRDLTITSRCRWQCPPVIAARWTETT